MPLVGIGSQIPFFRRLIDWLGIKIQSEAREQYKSFIAQYTEDHLTEPQTQNQEELLNSLNDLMLQRIAKNRMGKGSSQIQGLSSLAVLGEGVQGLKEQINSVQASSTAVTASSPIEDGEKSRTPIKPDSPITTAETTSLAAIPSNIIAASPDARQDTIEAIPSEALAKVRWSVLTIDQVLRIFIF